MGVVYRGVDRETERLVAIKTLRGDAVHTDQPALERFKREAELLRQLNHPNIVQVLSTLEQDGALWIVMEYAEGGSLAATLRRERPMRIARVLSIALDVADAMTRVHRLGILHRDIKPENVLLASDGSARLSDFGISHLAGRPNQHGDTGVEGTVLYLSPEALSGEPLDARSDVWAFGILLFEMLAGHPPFRGDMTARIVMSIMTDRVPDLEAIRPDAPVALVDLIYRMLEKDAGARLRSVRLVGAELELLLQTIAPGEAVAASTNTPWSADASPFASAPTTKGTPNNLPAQTTPFVGRRREMAELARLVPETRLLTIVGVGGSGKTRVAQELGQSQIDRFPDGVFFVPLAPLREVDDIVTTIGDVVGLVFRPGVPRDAELLRWLSEKKLLLILDNFEHLLAGTARASMLLDGTEHLTIVATSREPLGLSPETLFRLEGIDIPERNSPTEALASFGAVELFQQRARRAYPAFTPDDDDLVAIATISRVVGGSPLAIVLAASWVELLRPREILHEIRRNLDFLQADQSGDERQRSMRVVFDAAWQRLSPDEQVAFARMAVFHGGFTRQAAEGTIGASLRTLATLVRHSLLHRDPTTGRYDIHELLRQYAERHLTQSGHSADAEARHAAWYAAFLQQSEQRISGADNVGAVADVETEIDNVRAAWDSAVRRGDLAVIGQSLNTLATYYMLRTMNEEALARFRPALDLVRAVPDEQRPIPLELGLQVRWSGALMNLRGYAHDDVGAGFARAHELCDRLGPSPLLAPVMFGLWAFNIVRAEYETSRKLARQLLEIGDSSGSPLLAIGGHHASAGSHVTGGELQRGAHHARRVLELYRPDYDPQIIAWYADHSAAATRGWHAIALNAMGRIDEAKVVERELHAFLEHLGHGNTHSLGLLFLSLATAIRRDMSATSGMLRELRSVGDRYGLPVYTAFADAYTACWNATPDTIGSLMQSGSLVRDGFGFKATTIYATLLRKSALELAAGRPVDALSTAEHSLDWIRTQGERLFEAEALRVRGDALRALRDPDGAEASYRSAVAVAREQGARLFELRTVIALSRLQHSLGRTADARTDLAVMVAQIDDDCVDRQEASQLLTELMLGVT